ncbi:Rpr2-domain-containing protein [Amniculicola lignicola CBS 123094]|uniref:Rpr2-domain-containing protein n=1 Tax=Amniculicola lignicola CBS 123094 TaxID=1392246 RepID=A0A6A5WUI8_9PLEO|nr:Rpr2-domain-containing protein [Amniculicola lignicola CBS 123094]
MTTPKKPGKGVPNRHLHARTTFLYQAATYLTLQATASAHQEAAPHQQLTESSSLREVPASTLALQLGSHLRAVSLKGQVRLSAELKRSICKACNAILVPGRTCTQEIENKSKGCKKPWADVLVTTCRQCGSKKRHPFGATRQLSKAKRANHSVPTTAQAPVDLKACSVEIKQSGPRTYSQSGIR